MMNIEITDYNVLIAFWLCFTRWSAILIQLPIFEETAVPGLVKVLGSLVITYAFFPYLQVELLKDITYLGVDNFWLLTAFHAVIGLLIGFFVKAIMQVFIGGGSIITQQVGFSMVRYFDPSAGTGIGPFEKLIQWTVLILIISSGALLPMFKGAFASFSSIHIYNVGKMAHSSEYFVMIFKNIFLSSLLLASPLIFCNIFIMSILGIIAKLVPQMNIIMVSFVVNIGLGLLIFLSCSDEFFQVAFKIYTDGLGEWFQFIG
ncbi:MAG: hypothetical protein A2202_03705 [Bdellovibrionales bacterium RIFOXYA1_FULL_36_14]|nr:MAG: hypothetical protein A2202_03705 [Bdellovibrionales bacterium RIFOXYA1_FULL_36_14]